MTKNHLRLEEFLEKYSECTDAQIYEVLNIFNPKELQAEELLFDKGDESRNIYFVCDGVLRAYTHGTDEKENILFFSMPDSFAFGNVMPGTSCMFSKRAIIDTELLCADFNSYVELIGKYLSLAKFHEAFLNRVHGIISKRLTNGLFDNAKQKYESFLEDYPNLLNMIPHYHVANYLGITPTQLSRIRKEIAS